MKFHGHWVATQDSRLVVTPNEFDETDLTPASNWSEAHQNDDPALPHGFIDPARVIAEVARRWLAAHPGEAHQFEEPAHGGMEIHTLEDFGRLCLRLAPGLQSSRSASPASVPSAPAGPAQPIDNIPFR